MLDTQYALFRDLDRRSVAGGCTSGDCLSAVQAKRQIIESEMNRENPLVADVLAGRSTFVTTYDSFSRTFRGLRRFVPMPHDARENERLAHLAKIVPNVGHFVRRSFFAADNPVAGIVYGVVAACAVSLVWAHSVRGEAEGPSGGSGPAEMFMGLAVMCGFAGFVVGSAAMLKYRTRDSRMIHAREAAAYMDLNYGFFRSGDDAAWEEFIRVQCLNGPGGAKVAAVPRMASGPKTA